MRPSQRLLAEMRAQADIERLADDDPSLAEGVAALADAVRDRGRVRLTGMGASLHAAHVLVPLLRRQGIDADAAVTSDLLHYGPERWDEPLIAISQSGASAEIEALLQRTDRLPRLWGITLDPDSPLGRTRSLVVPGGPERAYAASRSFTGTLDVLLRLDAALRHDERHLRAGHRALATLVTGVPEIGEPIADALGGAGMLVCTARGALTGVAEYAALLLMELRRRPAMALEAAQLRHGPLEAVDPQVGLVVLRAESPTTELVDRLIRDAAARGGPIVVIDAGPDGGPSGDTVHTVRLGELSEASAALAAPALLQPAAMILARRAGLEPGQALHSSKVTREQ